VSQLLMAMLVQRTATTHGRLLQGTDDLTEEQCTRWPAPTAPSMAWHLWHVARWADRYQALLPVMAAGSDPPPEPGRELWDVDALASRWGVDVASTGYGQTGMGMGHTAAANLPLPGNDRLRDYARRAFAEVEAACSAMEDRQLPVRGSTSCMRATRSGSAVSGMPSSHTSRTRAAISG
jgi:hypothetical protein